MSNTNENSFTTMSYDELIKVLTEMGPTTGRHDKVVVECLTKQRLQVAANLAGRLLSSGYVKSQSTDQKNPEENRIYVHFTTPQAQMGRN
ncbi:hypothetical protein [Arenimonas sp. MALMAid1274]|uniref:hypothetical protein n=1 Tax=Arenimonas sp. MALMAid1274 TaxID=3411630 RepID=UPI003BA18B6E